jgi:phosphoribosylaminoimidazole carboxylase
VDSPKDVEEAVKALGDLPLYAEKWCDFKKELAVMVIRSGNWGDPTPRLAAYPVVETVHQDSICTHTYMPPRGVGVDICDRAQQVAKAAIKTLWGRGVFAVEMFVLADGKAAHPSNRCTDAYDANRLHIGK